jgi:hypothetical protein
MHVIPAGAGIQPRGTPWIPAYAGMTIPPCVRYVCTPECITRSSPQDTDASGKVEGRLACTVLDPLCSVTFCIRERIVALDDPVHAWRAHTQAHVSL